MIDLLTRARLRFKIHEFARHKNPTLGAFISHLSIYKWARKKRLPYIAILEDNVTIYETLSQNAFKEVEEFISTERDWNQLYIGGSVDPSFNQVKQVENKYRGRIYHDFHNLHGTNAYIISEKHYNEILTHPKVRERFREYKRDPTRKGMAFDIFTRQFSGRFIHRPFLLPHRIVGSTINMHLDTLRQVYFHPTVVKICQFLFFRNIQVRAVGICTIGVIVLILLFILYSLFKCVISAFKATNAQKDERAKSAD